MSATKQPATNTQDKDKEKKEEKVPQPEVKKQPLTLLKSNTPSTASIMPPFG
mgnify:CR=1 FL=1